MHLGAINQQLSIDRPTTKAGFLQTVNKYRFTGAARPKDVLDFIDIARGCCEGTNALDKRNAIALLANIQSPSAFFPRLNMYKVVYDLVLRILEPRLVGQGPYGLCGPASFLVLLASTRPVEYATLAVSLTKFGKGTMNGLTIEPNDTVREHDPDETISDGDWLMAASLRNSDDALSDSLDHYGGTHPGLMFGWLKDAGYATVLCIPSKAMANAGISFQTLKALAGSWLFLDFFPAKPDFLINYTNAMLTDPLGNLPLAQRFCQNGWKVLMQITESLAGTTGPGDPVESRVASVGQAYTAMGMATPPQMIADAKRQAVAALVGAKGPNHWVLVKRVITEGSKVSLTRYSWGTKEVTSPIALDLFCQVYGGFIAVSELDVASAAQAWR